MTETDDRYLYALVAADRGDPASFSATGVADESARVLSADGIGAVVHDCDGLYDSDDPKQVQTWLLGHQRVVDAATEAFGTPLPVRFDTVLQGGDGAVREWVGQRGADIESALDRFAGHREYRIGVQWDPGPFESTVRDTDDKLREIDAARADGDSGTAFLRDKQFEQRLTELRRQRRDELETALLEQVTPVVAATTHQEQTGGLGTDSAESDATETVCTVSVLSAIEDEAALGDRLDDYVDAYDVEVRFTGPWPPYSFAPELG